MNRIITHLLIWLGKVQASPPRGLAAIGVLITTVALGQQTALSGKVNEAGSGKPLSYATVLVKGTADATTTNANGEFTLRTSAPLPVTLSVTAVGFALYEVVAANSEPLAISL